MAVFKTPAGLAYSPLVNHGARGAFLFLLTPKAKTLTLALSVFSFCLAGLGLASPLPSRLLTGALVIGSISAAAIVKRSLAGETVKVILSKDSYHSAGYLFLAEWLLTFLALAIACANLGAAMSHAWRTVMWSIAAVLVVAGFVPLIRAQSVETVGLPRA